jgi:serine/threonine protein kinase
VIRRYVLSDQANYPGSRIVPLSAADKRGLYEILAPIGRGGMGDVYRTRDTNLTRDVAIWVLVRLPAMRR